MEMEVPFKRAFGLFLTAEYCNVEVMGPFCQPEYQGPDRVAD